MGHETHSESRCDGFEAHENRSRVAPRAFVKAGEERSPQSLLLVGLSGPTGQNIMSSLSRPPGLYTPSRDALTDDDLFAVLDVLARTRAGVIVSDARGTVRWISDPIRMLWQQQANPKDPKTPEATRPEVWVLESEAPGALASSHPGPIPAKLLMISEPKAETQQQRALSYPLQIEPFAVETESGEPVVLSVVNDATRANPTAQSPQPSSSLADVFDSWEDGILALSPSGRIAYLNEAGARLLDVHPRCLLDRPAAFLATRSPKLAEMLATIPLGWDTHVKLGPVLIEIEEPTGYRVHLQVSIQTTLNQRLVVLRDLSTHIARQQSLERKNIELDGYVQSISHDLRSPLVSLLGFSRLLRQDYGERLGETGLHFTDRIEQAADTMRALLDDLLELSRTDGEVEPRSMTDPRPVLHQLRAELKLRLEEMGAVLMIPEDPPWVYADRARLYQIFSNLVGNALQHMGECEDRTIEVRVVDRVGGSLISVADRGQGIPNEELDRVFEPFFSRGQTHRAGSTKGIGLNIVRKIAQAHEGRAWAESRRHGGIRFNVLLPHAR